MSSNASSNPSCSKRPSDHDESCRKIKKLDTVHMFHDIEISILVDNIINIWLKVSDVLKALEINNPKSNTFVIDEKYCKTLDEFNSSTDGKYKNVPNVHPDTKFINEIGMHLFVIRCNTPKGNAFVEWINTAVIPSIRKHHRHDSDEQLNEFKNRLAHLEYENAFLQSEIAYSKSVQAGQTSKIAQLESEIERLKSVQEKLESQDADSICALAHYQMLQKDLESEMADRASKIARLESENANLKSVRDRFAETIADLRNDTLNLKMLQTENAYLISVQYNLEIDNNDLAAEITDLKYDNAHLKSKKDRLESQTTALESEIERLKTVQEHLESENAALTSQIERSKSIQERFESEKADLTSQAARLETEITALRQRLIQVEAENVAIENEKAILSHTIGRLSERNDACLGHLRTVAQRVVDMQPSCVPELRNESKTEYFIVVKKTAVDDDPYPYYVLRIQKDSMNKRFKDVRERYGEFEIVQMFKTPNSVTFFNQVKQDLGHLIERSGQSFGLADDVTETRLKKEFEHLRDAGRNDISMKSIRSMLSGEDENDGNQI